MKPKAISETEALFLQLKDTLEATLRESGAGAETDGQYGRSLISVIQSAGSNAQAEAGLVRNAIENLLELSPSPDHPGELSLDHHSRKSSGSYYTPDYIVDHIVEASLRPALACAAKESSKLFSNGTRGEHLLRPYLDIFVIDAAVGTGRFLAAAAREIASAICDDQLAATAAELPHPRILQMVAENCLYGVDISPAAIEATRVTLFLEFFGTEKTRLALQEHLRVGDALSWSMPGVVCQQMTLIGEPITTDWPSQFPDAFNRNPAGFDAVVGNPPWVSFSGRQAVKIDSDTRRRFYARWKSAQGWPSSHGMFLQLAAELCRPGGRIGQIVPEQVLDLNKYASARVALFRETRLAEPPVSVGEKAFRGVTGPSCVMIVDRLGYSQSGVDCEPLKAVGVLTPNGVQLRISAESDAASAIVEKMKRFPPLPPKAFGDPGVHTGNSADLLLRKVPEPGVEPLLVGKDIVRCFAGEPGLWLKVPSDCPEGRYYRIARRDRYTDAVILVRQTAAFPIAARNANSGHFRNSLLACYGCDGFSTEYLLAILNSSLIRFFHQHEYRDGRQKAFPQVKVGHLRSIPVPNPPSEVAEELANLVRRMEEFAACGAADDMAVLDKAVDRLVYRLYELTEEDEQTVETYLGDLSA